MTDADLIRARKYAKSCDNRSTRELIEELAAALEERGAQLAEARAYANGNADAAQLLSTTCKELRARALAVEAERDRWKEHYNVAEKRSDKQALTLIDMHCEVAGLRQLLQRIEPYIDSIVCYASTCGEYAPNQIAVDLRAALARPTATGGGS